MDVLARKDTNYFPPVSPEELVTKQYVDSRTFDVPYIMRVDVWRGFYQQYMIDLQFDRPCPANCFVQFWRFSRNNVSARHNKKRCGFRPIGLDTVLPAGAVMPGNAGGFPKLAIPLAATGIHLGSIANLFRPPQIQNLNRLDNYSRYYREVTGAAQNNDIPAWMRSGNRRDVKCILKFGVIQAYREPGTNYWIEKRGPPSAETVTIMRWRFDQGQSVNSFRQSGWGLKVDMT